MILYVAILDLAA